MNENKIKTDLCSPVSYKEILQKFDFAQPFMDDADLFNSNSETSRNFLIQTFAFIHPDFHYLSFLNKEIDQEIIRAAEILQILPINSKKGDKLFDNLSDSEVKMFWSKLFSLLNCKKNDNFYVDFIRTSQEKFSFFKDVSKILDYVHHELPVVKEKTLSKETLNKEIESWNHLGFKCCHAQEDSSVLNYDTPEVEHINIEQLLMDLKQVTSMLKTAHFPGIVNKPEHLEFLSNFTSLTQNMDQYVMNLKEMSSPFLDELHHKMISDTKLIHSSSSERFQSEYIEYLQNRNAELLNRLANMKEIYENKIFSKDLNQHYFISTLVDVLNVCAALPEEVDMLFDKMSEAMSVLINVLSRKSKLIQLGEKISKLLNPLENEDLIGVQTAEEANNISKSSRKAGTVKVSPMINGHIISTEPRIYLNRVSGDQISNRNDSHRLSPILEISPDVASDSSNVKHHNFKELKVISERLNLSHGTYNFISQESPKGRFKGTKIWKKSLSSNQQTQSKKDLLENGENLEKLDALETGQLQTSENNYDPLEGPSWLYESQQNKSSPKCFIDFRRRRHRYARVFDKNEDDINCFKNEELKDDNIFENISKGESCNECDSREDLKSLKSESSWSFLESDEEYTPCTKKQKFLRKRRKCDNESCDGDVAQKRSLRCFSNRKEKKNSDMSDSSYEGDNEENASEKSKSTRKSYKNNQSKSFFESESVKSLPKESSEKWEFDCQESQISLTRNNECSNLMSYDINFLMKDALGREVRIPVEDCMKGKENSKKEKLSRVRSNASRSKSETKSSTMNSSNDKKITEICLDQNLSNQNQRSRRKAAPTNLTEPKLGTKLRRS